MYQCHEALGLAARGRHNGLRVSTVTIDLGAAGEAWDEPTLDRRPVGTYRSWGLALALVGTIALSSAVPMPARPQEIVRLPLGIGTFQLDGGTLFLLDDSRRSAQVTAIDPADGHPLWRYAPQGRFSLAQAQVSGGIAVLAPEPCISGALGLTVALDVHTGRELWRADGVAARIAPEMSTVVITRGSWSDRCGAVPNSTPMGGSVRWYGVDRDSGAPRWQVVAEPGTRVAVDSTPAGPRWAALFDRQGQTTVVDFATGGLSPPTRGIANPDDLVAAAGELIIVARWGLAANYSTLAAYDRTTLAPRWTVLLPLVDASSRRPWGFAVHWCGPNLCVRTNRTTAHAPETGELRWQAPRVAFVETPAGLLAVGDSNGAGVYLSDPLTGRSTAALPHWRFLAGDPAHGRILIGLAEGDSTLLAWLVGTGSPQALGRLRGRFDTCQLAGDRAACQTNLDEVWLLKVRRDLGYLR